LTEDFYCDEVLSGKTAIEKVLETENILAYFHTRPYYEHHIVVIPKKHIPSLISVDPEDEHLLLELLAVVRQVAAKVTAEKGACRVLTNLGRYQDSKHLHFHVAYGPVIRA
jgi:histidine triad (HIT) family protein